MISVTVDRSSLGLADMLIDSDGFGSWCITPGGYVEPQTTPRTATVRSPFVHGDLATQSVLDTTDLVLEVMVQGNTTAQLENRVDALRNAFCMQLDYTVTRTIDGVFKSFSAAPATMIRSGPVRKGEVMAHVATYTLSVPVYPVWGD